MNVYLSNKIVQAGMTLVELLIAIAIAAILMAVAVPSMITFLDRNAVNTACSELADTLTMAKAEGIRRSADTSNLVLVAPSCGATSWSQGWQIFMDDQSAPNQCYNTATDTLIQASNPPTRNVSIAFVNSNATGQFVGFNGQGLPRDTVGAFVAGTWTCSKSGVSDVTVVMSSLGRVRGKTGL